MPASIQKIPTKDGNGRNALRLPVATHRVVNLTLLLEDKKAGRER